MTCMSGALCVHLTVTMRKVIKKRAGALMLPGLRINSLKCTFQHSRPTAICERHTTIESFDLVDVRRLLEHFLIISIPDNQQAMTFRAWIRLQ